MHLAKKSFAFLWPNDGYGLCPLVPYIASYVLRWPKVATQSMIPFPHDIELIGSCSATMQLTILLIGIFHGEILLTIVLLGKY
jgi:hypothetical protein